MRSNGTNRQSVHFIVFLIKCRQNARQALNQQFLPACEDAGMDVARKPSSLYGSSVMSGNSKSMFEYLNVTRNVASCATGCV